MNTPESLCSASGFDRVFGRGLFSACVSWENRICLPCANDDLLSGDVEEQLREGGDSFLLEDYLLRQVWNEKKERLDCENDIPLYSYEPRSLTKMSPAEP